MLSLHIGEGKALVLLQGGNGIDLVDFLGKVLQSLRSRWSVVRGRLKNQEERTKEKLGTICKNKEKGGKKAILFTLLEL